ncbi:MAG: hypothetical protein MI810_11600 [Flavobacteriales bacterium]|nr:hypothetical protein [Flavobacteriales bacterium]
MELKDLKKEMGRSTRKVLVGAIFIGLFGIFILWLLLSGVDKSSKPEAGGSVIIWILLIACLLIGGLMSYKAISDLRKLSKGTHPLIAAIQSKQTDFIVWMYEHVLQGRAGPTHNIWMQTKDGKQMTFTLKPKKIQPMLNYLHSQFPSADLGYSKELKTKHHKKSRESNDH